MKRRNILGKLKLELENSLPDSGEIIKNIKEAKVEKDLAPVYDAINNVNNVKALTIKYNIMYISGIMFLTMLLFTLLLILLPVFNALLYPEKPIVTKFGIDINPSIDLMLDENDEVVWVLAKNKHAEILLSGENFVGKHVKDATDKIIKLAARAGYFSTSPEQELNITNAVLISAVSENAEKQQSLLDSVKNDIKSFYMNNQIYGVVLTQFASKQELVDLVCSLDYDLTEEEKEDLKSQSVKNLNHMLTENYTNLKRRFKTDIILDEFKHTLKESNAACDAEIADYKQKLSETETKLNGFEEFWIAETDKCWQKIAEWHAQILILQEAIKAALNPEEVSRINAEIETKLMFVSSEEEEIANREVNGEMFNSSKNKLVAEVNNYKTQINEKKLQRLKNMEVALRGAKAKFAALCLAMANKKLELLKAGDKKLSEHLANLENYNDFYNAYSNWLVNTADKIPNFTKNWLTIKQEWEQNYANFVNV